MLFNTGEFCFVFLPITLLLFYSAAAWRLTRLAVWILGLASAIFYIYGTPVISGPLGVPVPPYLLLLLGSILINYWVGTYLRVSHKRWLLALGITINLSALAYFKYADFFVSNLNSWSGLDLVWPTVFLPLGISFYTFQSIAYLADCWKGKVSAHSIIDFAVFLHFFPQLIAGPIVHHQEILPQFRSRRMFVVNYRNLSLGFALFTVGLAKKTLLADHFGKWVEAPFNHVGQLSALGAWSAVLAYGFELYFDFSGYSDMAIGLGLLFNLRYPQNFNSPYKAISIIDFWRRWHITLSRFLRDYVYIPLGGNRFGKVRRYINLFVTMLLGGFWHGAAWVYIIWGAWHGLFLAINHAYEERVTLKMPFGLSRVLTLLVVFIGWSFFRSANLQDSITVNRAMLGLASGQVGPERTEEAWLVLALIIVLFLPNSNEIVARIRPNTFWTVSIIILFLMTSHHFDATTEFLYYRF